MRKTLFVLFALLLVFAFGTSDADAKTRKKSKKAVASSQSTTKSKTSMVQDADYDEEEAKVFAYSYFERPHGCWDLEENKDFFTKSSYKTIKAKIDRMARKYELQNPGDDPFDVYTEEGSQTEIDLFVNSLGDGIFECKNSEEGLIGDGDPFYIKKARIKVVKINGKYKIAALYDFEKNKWVP